jgi:O-antigen/teichoic acid export membrane protein
MSKISNLIRQSKNPTVRSIGIYTFTNFFAKGASFLLLFIFTNPVYILPSENGLLSLLSNSMIFLMPFLSMGIMHSTSTDFFKLDKQEFRSFFTTGLIMPFFVAVLSGILLYIFRDYLQRKFGFPYLFIWVIPTVTFLTFCYEQLLSLVRNNNEPFTYLKVNVSKTILELGISVILVVFFAWRWKGRIAGIVISYIIIGIYAFVYFIRKEYIFGSIRKKVILGNLVYAIPIFLLQLSIFSMNSLDKFLLSNFTNDNNESVGIYSIACIISAVILLFCTALLQYLFPKIYRILSSDKVDYVSIRKHFYYYVYATLSCTVVVIVLTPLIYKYFINMKYHSSLKYSYIICMGYFFWTITYFFYSFLLYDKRKKKIAILSLCCMATSVCFQYFFIRQWQAMGAAFAVFTSYFVVLMITLFFTREYWQHFLFNGKSQMINDSSKQDERTDL